MKSADTRIQNVIILTMDKDRKIIENGFIDIKDDSILHIGRQNESHEYPAPKQCIDGNGMLLMPGLINCHTHAAMSLFRGFADDMPLQKWLNDYIWPVESEFINASTVATGTRLAISEMIEAGITQFADMYFFEDEVAKECEKAGIRVLLGEAIIDFQTPNMKTPEEGLNYTAFLNNKWNDHPLIRTSVAPHSIYACSSSVLNNVNLLSHKLGIDIQMHLAETAFEIENIKKTSGKSAAEYLYSLNMLDRRLIASHMIHLTEEEIQLSLTSGVRIAHNPQSNLKLASGFINTTSLIKPENCIGFGTDGAASNNDLDIIAEMQTTALMGKHLQYNPSACDALQMVEMATIKAAKVLGTSSITGSLELGKKADLILINLSKPHMNPIYNIYSHLVYSIKSSDIESVMVNGRWLMKNKVLLSIDIENTMEEVKVISNKIRQKFTHFNHGQ